MGVLKRFPKTRLDVALLSVCIGVVAVYSMRLQLQGGKDSIDLSGVPNGSIEESNSLDSSGVSLTLYEKFVLQFRGKEEAFDYNNASSCLERCTHRSNWVSRGEEALTPPLQEDDKVASEDDEAVPQCIHFLHKFREDHGALAGGSKLESDKEELPPRYLSFINKWKRANPSNCIVKHRLHDIVELLQKNAALHWLELLGSYNHYIQKCDISRYLLMFFTGGVYTDLDVEVKQELAVIQERHPKAKVFLGTERVLPSLYAEAMRVHRIRNGTGEHSTRVANFWMMSTPKHPFWLHVLKIAEKRSTLPIVENYDILFTTGPDLITEAYVTYQEPEKDEVVLLSKAEFSALLRHHSDGSWRASSRSWLSMIFKDFWKIKPR